MSAHILSRSFLGTAQTVYFVGAQQIHQNIFWLPKTTHKIPKFVQPLIKCTEKGNSKTLPTPVTIIGMSDAHFG
jgi:hypothetical protein